MPVVSAGSVSVVSINSVCYIDAPKSKREEVEGMENVKMKISTLWIVVMLSMLTIDILGIYILLVEPGALDEMREFLGETAVTQAMLIAEIFMAIHIISSNH